MSQKRNGDDTVNLLSETNSGTKMAVASFDEVIDKIRDDRMRQIIEESKSRHEELGNKIHDELLKHGADDKEPSPIAKGMSWMKTNMKMSMDDSDATIAALMTEGCDMGIRSLYQYMHQYAGGDKVAFELATSLSAEEEQLREALKAYL